MWAKIERSCAQPERAATLMPHFKALLWESSILLLPSPNCKAYPIAILLHAQCAIYAPSPTPPLYAIHNTIFVMAISCQGQVERETAVRGLNQFCAITVDPGVSLDTP